MTQATKTADITTTALQDRKAALEAELAEINKALDGRYQIEARLALLKSIENLKGQEIPGGIAGDFRDLAASAFLPEGTPMSFDGLFDALFSFREVDAEDYRYTLLLTDLDAIKAAVERNDYSR